MFFCVIPFGWSFPLRYCNVRYINKPHKHYHCLLTLICMCVCVSVHVSAPELLSTQLVPLYDSARLCQVVIFVFLGGFTPIFICTQYSPQTHYSYFFFAFVPRYTVGPLAKVQFWLPYADRDPRRGPGRFARTTVTSVISSGFESIWAGIFLHTILAWLLADLVVCENWTPNWVTTHFSHLFVADNVECFSAFVSCWTF